MNWSSRGRGHVVRVTWRQQRLNTTIYSWLEWFIFNFKILFVTKMSLVNKNSPKSLTSVPLGTYLSPIHWGSVKSAEPMETRIAPPPTHQALFPFPPSHATSTTTDNDPISTADTIAPTSVVFRLFYGLFRGFRFLDGSQLGTIMR